MCNSAIDPIRLEILWNRLIAAVDEQAAVLLRTSFSPVVREAGDLAAAVFDGRGRMVAQSVTGTPGHINSTARAVEHFLREYPVDSLVPGDVLITNDPWIAAGQLLDICVLTPVFRKKRLIGFFASTCHAVDVGGYGVGAGAKDLYEEGLRIMPTKLYSAGRPNEELFKIIRSNVRDPIHVLGDISAQVGANETGGRRLVQLCDEYGLEDIESLSDAILARSEVATRAAISQLPSGVYEASSEIDGFDEPIRIKVAVIVEGDEITLDFSGTSMQTRYGINVVLNYTAAYATFAVRSALCPEVPNNTGSLKPIKVVAPEGCILNCTPPAPTAGRHIVGMFVPGPILMALAQVVPDRVMSEGAGAVWTVQIQGSDEAGRQYVTTMFTFSGGTGGRPMKDGLSTTAYPTGVSSIPIEILESTTPIVFERKEFRPDSGGPGKFRGGLGQTVEFRVNTGREWLLNAMVDRTRRPAQGLLGGRSGALGEITLADGTRIDTSARRQMNPSDRVIMHLPGGGGYGRPEERDVQRVLDDVFEGLVSLESAASDYGVVINADLTVDEEATSRARQLMRAAGHTEVRK